MKLFNCNVRLGGNVLSDVPKYDVSEMEIRVMQDIHGDDAVINIKSAGSVERSKSEEAGRLANDYNPKVVSEVTGIKGVVPLLVDEDDEPETVATVATVDASTDETPKSNKAAIE